MGHSLLLFPDHKKGTRSEVEQLGHDLASIWDADATTPLSVPLLLLFPGALARSLILNGVAGTGIHVYGMLCCRCQLQLLCHIAGSRSQKKVNPVFTFCMVCDVVLAVQVSSSNWLTGLKTEQLFLKVTFHT